mmetsp:Transcript_4029/g.12245  ORF Transcript_4029/g.12245 Transcript_4029/m.12245 type:complete len:216 (+) Transcript_4029:812-1459(+)
MPVKKPCALVKPVIQYDFISDRLFSNQVFSMTWRSVSPVNQPPKLGIIHEISCPLASLVQMIGTRASKIEPTSANNSVVITTVPSMAYAMFLRLVRTILMMFCKRCNSWKRKMLSGAWKPLSGVFGGPLSFVIWALKTSSTKSSGILLVKSTHISLTISSMDLPPLPPESLGCVSMMVAIISAASLRRYVRSAFGCKPKIMGESTGGNVSTASRN